MTRREALKIGLLGAGGPVEEERVQAPSLPDPLIVEGYEQAARRNVLAAVNPAVFPGYFSVCADGKGFGYGNTYPSLDGHQLSDALLWLGQTETVRQNFEYVRRFQRDDGLLPIAILPKDAGKTIGPAGYTSVVDPNGGLYRHWVPGNPLEALASPTYIQNSDVIFRSTLDLSWLKDQIGSVNRAARYLSTLITPAGAVRGAGYYVERPTRIDCDGVTQPHAVDAFRRAASLNRVLGDHPTAVRMDSYGDRIQQHFIQRFWTGDRFAEYIHPERGPITSHGFTDADWAALAFHCATPKQQAALWPKLRSDPHFYYGGMPTGIATEPDRYEPWEFTHPDRQDLAAMGRVWYVEAQARARMGDADGLLDSIRRVCRMGRDAGWYWRERYRSSGGYGAQKYCEYPANLIRIVQRFLLGVAFGADGTLTLAPVASAEFWKQGFGQKLLCRNSTLEYRFQGGRLTGTYEGSSPLRVLIRTKRRQFTATLGGSRSPQFDIRL